MRAVVVHAAGDVRIERRPRPEPGPPQALVAMTHGGACGSDLHYWRHGAVGALTLAEPLTLGHEVVGTIDDAIALPAGTARPEVVITHTFPPADAAQALAAAGDPARSGKAVLRLDT